MSNTTTVQCEQGKSFTLDQIATLPKYSETQTTQAYVR